jgi:hypothetical protein
VVQTIPPDFPVTASQSPMLPPITLCIVNYNGAEYLNYALHAASQVRVLALNENRGALIGN